MISENKISNFGSNNKKFIIYFLSYPNYLSSSLKVIFILQKIISTYFLNIR